MSEQDLRNELGNAAVEPLLPIEKKLIGWSLSLGIGLLLVLLIVNHLYPIRSWQATGWSRHASAGSL